MYELIEKDWIIYKKNIGIWQERHMKRLLNEYQKIINSSDNAANVFWLLEKRINKDKKCSGVIVELRRSAMFNQLLDLVINNVITIDEISIFSIELQENIKRYISSL